MARVRWLLALMALCAVEARAQRVKLELRPRAGDTLHMRFDQVTELSGTRRNGPLRQVVSRLKMFSRAIVERTDPASAVILAVTDSVEMTSSDERTAGQAKNATQQLSGRQMRLRVALDGTVSLADPKENVPREVNDLVAVMPASFPRGSVAVGDVWLREMPIPPSASSGIPLAGVVRAVFRLDSVSREGEVAYVSMKGTLQQGADTGATDQGALAGSVTGSMVVDQHRGWLSESKFLIQLRGTMVTPGAKPGYPPMQFRLKITQHMRVAEQQ